MVGQADDQPENLGKRRPRRLRDEMKTILKTLGLIARGVLAIVTIAKWLDH